MTDLATNVLYHGDNLDIPHRSLPETCVDLVSLDPLLAFEDAWHD